MAKKAKSAPEHLPPSIDAIPDAMLRYRAAEAWRAVKDVLECIEAWSLFLEALPTEKGRPLEAFGLRDRVGRALNRLSASGAVDPEFSPVAVLGMFPEPPRTRLTAEEVMRHYPPNAPPNSPPWYGYCLPDAIKRNWGNMVLIRRELTPRLEELRVALESCPLGVFEAQPVVEEGPAVVPATPKQLSTSATPDGKDPTAQRNAKFVELYETEGTPTYHSPARIARWWRDLGAKERADICPNSSGLLSTAGVRKSIQRTRKGRDNR